MGWLKRRREARIERDATAVLKAIKSLRPSQSNALLISRLSYVGIGRTYVALARLERSGRVVSDWADGPAPRRRLYRVASEVQR